MLNKKSLILGAEVLLLAGTFISCGEKKAGNELRVNLDKPTIVRMTNSAKGMFNTRSRSDLFWPVDSYLNQGLTTEKEPNGFTYSSIAANTVQETNIITLSYSSPVPYGAYSTLELRERLMGDLGLVTTVTFRDPDFSGKITPDMALNIFNTSKRELKLNDDGSVQSATLGDGSICTIEQLGYTCQP